jgi:hypothetical protein
MKIGSKRRRRLSEFTIKEYGINGIFVAALFLFGLFLSGKLSAFAGMLYVLLWLLSYPVIHATLCRNCVYHGKQCPVPFEGSCSHLAFDKGHDFGILAGIGGFLAYFMRVCIPYVAIFQMGSVLYFILFTGIIAGFLYVLLYHTGCPNCINTKCPLNPDDGT